MRLTIPARTQAPFWQEWKAEFEGRTPWEAAQVVAFEVLSQIYQQQGDELTGNAAGIFPQVDPSTTIWAQHNRNALIRDRDERTDSSSPAMGAMFAVMKMFYTCQDYKHPSVMVALKHLHHMNMSIIISFISIIPL